MEKQLWPNLSEMDSSAFESIASPGLLVDAGRVEGNLAAMITAVGGDTSRLRPHVKTHKMSRVIKMQQDAGIEQFKVATLAEAEMVAGCGAKDILIAYPLVGPNLDWFGRLVSEYNQTRFSCLVDDPEALSLMEKVLGKDGNPTTGLWIDVDCGMSRTGVPLGSKLDMLRDKIETSSSFHYRGLHVYDGHLHQPDVDERHQDASLVLELLNREMDRNPSPELVVGGSPTFGFWSQNCHWQCSPGTPMFWDHGYGYQYSELPFQIALAMLTRVISKPNSNLLCFDLGYKSVAAEMPLARRVIFPGISDAVFVGQSEEHLVVQTALADKFGIGEVLIALPRHVCPTVALHRSVAVMRNGQLMDERWEVDARDRLGAPHGVGRNS